MRGLPGVVFYCRYGESLGKQRAVFASALNLTPPRTVARHPAPQGPEKTRVMVAGVQQHQGLTYRLRGGKPCHLCEGLVDPQNHLVLVENANAFLGFEGGGRNAQVQLGLLAVSDVLRDREVHHRALVVQGCGVGCEPAPLPFEVQ